MSDWWESHDNRIELAHWLLIEGWFTYPIDMLYFFEKLLQRKEAATTP